MENANIPTPWNEALEMAASAPGRSNAIMLDVILSQLHVIADLLRSEAFGRVFEQEAAGTYAFDAARRIASERDELQAKVERLTSRGIEDLRHENDELRTERDEAVAKADGAYAERDRLVAALSKVFTSYLARHPEDDATWDDDWRWIVFVNLPTGQASWHIHDSERSWFDHLEVHEGEHWDGHTTVEKYERVELLPNGCAVPEAEWDEQAAIATRWAKRASDAESQRDELAAALEPLIRMIEHEYAARCGYRHTARAALVEQAKTALRLARGEGGECFGAAANAGDECPVCGDILTENGRHDIPTCGWREARAKPTTVELQAYDNDDAPRGEGGDDE